MNGAQVFVTLSTFGAESGEPERLLESSGFTYAVNSFGRRMEPLEVVERARDSIGLIAGVEKYDAATLARLPQLKCISRCGVGIDNIETPAAERLGIGILNTPDEPTVAVAEHVLSLILGLLKRQPVVDGLMHRRQWQRVTGNLLAGKVVGIIGLGRIGRRVAELVSAFGAKVIAVEPRPDTGWAGTWGVDLTDLRQLLARADIVSIHVSTSADSRFCLGKEELAMMKPGSWLVNTARGDMVDEAALVAALESGRLSGAGLDVFTSEPYAGPLCDNDRVILSPHQATLTFETRAAMETRAVENLLRYLRGEA